MKHIMENGCHCMFIGSSRILQSERHNSIIEVSKGCSESRLFSILWIHLDLIISTKTIHEREVQMTWSSVNKRVNVQQRKFVFWTSFVLISKVDAYSNLAILLLYWYNIFQPLLMFDGLNEPCLQELFYFICDLKFEFVPRYTRCLFDRAVINIYI